MTPNMNIFIFTEIEATDSLTFAFRDKDSSNNLEIKGGSIFNRVNIELIKPL